MTISKKLLVSDDLLPKKNKIVRNLKLGVGQLGLFVIALSDGDDLFDIYPIMLFKQRMMRRMPFHIVGLASSNEEATQLIQDYLVQMLNRHANAASLKEYVVADFIS